MAAAPSPPVRETWSTGAEVAGAPWQTRRPPPLSLTSPPGRLKFSKACLASEVHKSKAAAILTGF